MRVPTTTLAIKYMFDSIHVSGIAGTTPAYRFHMAKLTFSLEDGQVVEVPLADLLSIGRGEDNDVVVNDEGLSLQHAELRQKPDGSYELHDLDSATGTFVNEQRVTTRSLHQGDRLTLGSLTAILDLEEPAPAELVTATADTPTAKLDATTADLRAAEAKLSQVQAAIQQADAVHREKLTASQALAIQHEEQTASLQKITAAITRAQQQLTDHDQRRTQLEAQLQELSSTEGKLSQAQLRIQEAEIQYSALTTTITTLSQDRKRQEESLRQVQSNLNSCEIHLATRRAELAAETKKLEDAKKNRRDLATASLTLTLPVAKPAPEPKPPAPPPSAPAAAASLPRANRIVAIGSTRSNVIPMKSERIIKKTTSPTPKQGS